MGVAIGTLVNLVSRARFLVAAPTLTVGTVRQLEDAAAGCALGVGLTPWNHVEVP